MPRAQRLGAHFGTYYGNIGRWVTMRTATTSATTLVDTFSARQVIQAGSASNAPPFNAADFVAEPDLRLFACARALLRSARHCARM
jgi:hypothetical protein